MLKYLGGGFIVGVPARDLTDDEAKQFDRAVLIRSGLYEAKQQKVEPAKSEKTLVQEAS